jgi:4-hydroxy-tetrahydrodipicolinate synthase
MNNTKFRGCGTALITPFRNGAVDYDAFAALVDRQVAGGIDFLVPLGTTGETPCLSDEEKIKILHVTGEHAAGLPIVAGVGTNSLEHTIANIKLLEPHGVDAFLVVVPYYNKPPQEGMYQYYKAVAASTQKPIILYNVPGRTGVNMLPETTLRLAADCKNVVGIKEASGNVEQIEYILRNRPEGFKVFSGDDGITLPLIKSGADGVISVIGNAYAAEFAEMVHLTQAGDYMAAEAIDNRLTELYRLIFVDGNPAGIKCVMELRGMLQNVLRLPLVPATKATCEKIVAALL